MQAVGVGKNGRVTCDDEVRYDIDRLPSRDETRALYDSVGWGAYTDDMDALIRGLENSAVVVTARSGGELVGLARIVSDRATIAYLQDILVHPSLPASRNRDGTRHLGLRTLRAGAPARAPDRRGTGTAGVLRVDRFHRDPRPPRAGVQVVRTFQSVTHRTRRAGSR